MDWQDEVHAIFRVYGATGRTPEMPDRALLPQSPVRGADGWFARLAELDPRAAARIRHAIEQGARNGAYAAPWTELG